MSGTTSEANHLAAPRWTATERIEEIAVQTMPFAGQQAGDGADHEDQELPLLCRHGAHVPKTFGNHFLEMIFMGDVFLAGNNFDAHEDGETTVQNDEGQVGQGVFAPGRDSDDAFDLIHGDERHFRTGEETIAR